MSEDLQSISTGYPRTREEFEYQMALEYVLDEAVSENNVNVIKDIVISDSWKVTPYAVGAAMCDAARRGHAEIVSLFLAAGWNPNAQCQIDSFWKRKPIHLAAANGHLEIVQMLIRKGVEIESRDNEERTPLHWAVSEGKLEIAKYLIEQGAAVNALQSDGFTVLHGAAWLGDYQLCKLLITHGAEVNKADSVAGMTPFHSLASLNSERLTVELFLEAGADVNAKTTDLESPLHMAAMTSSEEIVELLVSHGAELEARDNSGETPLFRAVMLTNVAICQVLLDLGADINVCNDVGQSLLYTAMQSLCEKTITLLVDEGCQLQSETWLKNKQWPFSSSSRPDLCAWLSSSANSAPELQVMCRCTIRKRLRARKKQKSSQLPLPVPLQEYVGEFSECAK